MRWPFPFIPFLNKDNEELLSSPIPLIACVLEHSKSANSDLNFFSTDGSSDNNIVHYHLDLNKKRGVPKVDLREMAAKAGNGVYKRLKEIRTLIKDEYPTDFLLKNLYEPKHRALVKYLGMFVDEIKSFIKSIYFKDERLAPLIKSVSGRYTAVRQSAIENADYDEQSMDILLSSQMFQMHLEKRQQQTSTS